MMIFMICRHKKKYDSLNHIETLSNANDLYNNEQISGNNDDLINMSF